MSYEKNTWAKGDVITANKLNHMEDGIAESGGGAFIVRLLDTNYLDKTYGEIYQAFLSGKVIWVVAGTSYCPLDDIQIDEYEGEISMSITTFHGQILGSDTLDHYPYYYQE